MARYMYGEPLQYAPGDSARYTANDRYSNSGTCCWVWSWSSAPARASSPT
ncbi:hypothetical protein ACFQX7_29120 [Luedemannella flava]